MCVVVTFSKQYMNCLRKLDDTTSHMNLFFSPKTCLPNLIHTQNNMLCHKSRILCLWLSPFLNNIWDEEVRHPMRTVGVQHLVIILNMVITGGRVYCTCWQAILFYRTYEKHVQQTKMLYSTQSDIVSWKLKEGPSILIGWRKTLAPNEKGH